MQLTLAHQLLLLELDDTTGSSLITDFILRYFALGGALVAELNLRDRLVATSANEFAIVDGPPLPGVLGLAEGFFPPRPLDLNHCVYRLGNRADELRSAVLEELVQAGALRKDKDKFWLLTYRTRWPTQEEAIERTLVEHLRAWLPSATQDAAPSRDDLLLSLLRCAGLLTTVWTEAELEQLRPLIDELTDRAPIGATVRGVTMAVHAVMAS